MVNTLQWNWTVPVQPLGLQIAVVGALLHSQSMQRSADRLATTKATSRIQAKLTVVTRCHAEGLSILAAIEQTACKLWHRGRQIAQLQSMYDLLNFTGHDQGYVQALLL